MNRTKGDVGMVFMNQDKNKYSIAYAIGSYRSIDYFYGDKVEDAIEEFDILFPTADIISITLERRAKPYELPSVG